MSDPQAENALLGIDWKQIGLDALVTALEGILDALRPGAAAQAQAQTVAGAPTLLDSVREALSAAREGLEHLAARREGANG